MRSTILAVALAGLASVASAAPVNTEDKREAAPADTMYVGDGLYVVRTLAKKDMEEMEKRGPSPEEMYVGDGLYVVRTLAKKYLDEMEKRDAAPADTMYVGDGLYVVRTLAKKDEISA